MLQCALLAHPCTLDDLLLFIVYINDLAGVSERLFTILFADDTTILIEGTQANSRITSLNSELAKLTDWLKANKLSINVFKTHYMVIDIDVELDMECIHPAIN